MYYRNSGLSVKFHLRAENADNRADLSQKRVKKVIPGGK